MIDLLIYLHHWQRNKSKNYNLILQISHFVSIVVLRQNFIF